MAKRKNIYIHDIDLKKISLKNAQAKDFADKLEKIPYRGYEVEDISDGRKIVIVKPGGKQSFGKIRKEDFLFLFTTQPTMHYGRSHTIRLPSILLKKQKTTYKKQ